MMLLINYQDSRLCGFRQEDFFTFSLYKPIKYFTPGTGPFLAPGVNLNKLGRGP